MDGAECVRGCRSRSSCEGQDGDTALMAAARNNKTEAVKALIEAGAEKDLQNKVSLLPPSLSSLPLPACLRVERERGGWRGMFLCNFEDASDVFSAPKHML